MKRVENWVEKLSEYLCATLAEPFAWGTHDCAIAVSDAVLAQTGFDIASGFRGRYSSEEELQELLEAEYEGSLEILAERVAMASGMTEISPQFAQRGDVVLFDSENGPSLGIVLLDGFRFRAVYAAGAVAFRMNRARRAWRLDAPQVATSSATVADTSSVSIGGSGA